MTGMQPTPESGVTADGHPGKSLSIEELVKGCGVKYLKVVNPYDIKGLIKETEKAYQYTLKPDGGMAVLIARYPCIIHQKDQIENQTHQGRHSSILPLRRRGFPN